MQRRYFRTFIVALVCLALMLPVWLSGAALAAPTSPAGITSHQTGPYVTANTTTNVRGGPGIGFWVIGVLYRGGIVPVLGVSPDGTWWYVDTTSGQGWVSDLNVTASGTANVPVHDPGPTALVTTGVANVRSGAGINALRLGQLQRGAQVLVLAQSADGGWLQIQWAYGTGWVSASLVSLSGMPGRVDGAVPVTGDLPYGIVLAAYLNVRTGAGINYAILGQVFGGDELPIVGRNEDNSWYQVETRFGTGWVYGEYLATRNEYGASPVTAGEDARAPATGPIGIINTGALNIRSGPSRDYTALFTLAGGDETQIIGRTRDWSWWLLDTDLGTGWASAIYIIVRGDTSNVPYVAPGDAVAPSPGLSGGTSPDPEAAFPVAVVNTGALHIRSGPNGAFASLGVVYMGDRMDIIGQSPDKGWWMVDSPFGDGWVSKLYVLVDGDTSGVPIR